MNLLRVGLLATVSTLIACGEVGIGIGANEIAVIDLNEAARVTGQEDVIRSKVEGASAELTDELRALLTNMESQLQAEREKLGANPAAIDLQRLQALTVQAQQQIGQAQAEANRQVTVLESQLAQEFRDKLLPLARKEASSRGASVVLAKDAYLFWSDEPIDITPAVITAWDNLPADQKIIGGINATDDVSGDSATDAETVDPAAGTAEGAVVEDSAASNPDPAAESLAE